MLTKEEKQKIEEEERYRQELRGTSQGKKTKKPRGCLKWVFIIIISLFVIPFSIGLMTSTSNEDTEPTPKQPVEKDLVGTVSIKNQQIVITNEENRNWNRCRLTLNEEYTYPPEEGFMGGETKRIATLAGEEAYTFSFSEFIKNGDERFNILTTKPMNLSVYCQNGFGYWKW